MRMYELPTSRWSQTVRKVFLWFCYPQKEWTKQANNYARTEWISFLISIVLQCWLWQDPCCRVQELPFRGSNWCTDFWTLRSFYIGLYVVSFPWTLPNYIFFFIVINSTTLSITMSIIKWWSGAPFMTVCWRRVRYISHLFLPELNGSKLWRSPYHCKSYVDKSNFRMLPC